MAFKQLTIDELLTLLNKYKHKELHVHHTWRPDHSNFNGSNHQQLQQNMKNYHVNTNGWSDIGQHVSLFPDGLFLVGRDFSKTPASIKGYNTGSFCMEMIGNFDVGEDKLEGKQLESALKLAHYFLSKDRYVRFHRENSGKTCPGTSINKDEFLTNARNAYEKPHQKKEEYGVFSDVPKSHWAFTAIEGLAKDGLLSGRGGGRFYPDDALTRAEFASVLYSILNKQ